MKYKLLAIIVATAVLVIMVGCTPSITTTPTPTPSPTQTPTQSSQNQQPIQVISVLEPPQTPNPGGGIVEITLKNVANEPVVSLAAILTIRGPFNYDFDVTPSHPLLPGNSISAQLRLIGPNDGFGGGIPYSVTINGTLQSGATFAYTWEPIEVVSVLDTYKTGQTVNPGGPEIEITLKNAAVEPVVSLAATLDLLSIPATSGLRRSWNYAFEVTPSNPLLPGNSIGSKVRLIGGGFGGSLPYSVTINGTLQSGVTFAYTWEPTK